jgi:anion-transporting  ArsA/GET3 family ATPase
LKKKSVPYDLVIVDAPATGHALAMLEAPETFKKIARVGPIHRQAGYIQSFLHDPATTAIIAVATAEEMPVNETLDLRAELKARVGLDIALGVVNELEPEFFIDKEIAELRKQAELAPIEAAILQSERAKRQEEQYARLAKELKRPLIDLPFLYEKSIGRAELNELADKLAEDLSEQFARVAK